MNSLVDIQRWLYGGMANGLGDVAGGDPRAIFAAIAAAVLFGGSTPDAALWSALGVPLGTAAAEIFTTSLAQTSDDRLHWQRRVG